MSGAFFLGVDACFRAYTFTCDLNESEFAGRENGVFRTVEFHLVAQFVEEQAAVVRRMQVDKIDYDDAAFARIG